MTILVRVYRHGGTRGLIHNPDNNCDRMGGGPGREGNRNWRIFDSEREALTELGQPLHTCQMCFPGQGLTYPR